MVGYLKFLKKIHVQFVNKDFIIVKLEKTYLTITINILLKTLRQCLYTI